jgi:hypothetical protein
VPDLDPFLMFRTLVFVFLSVYFLLSLWYGASRLLDLLRGDDPSKRMLRTYLGYQIVSIRLRRLSGELFQIALLLATLAVIAWAHRLLDWDA